MTSGSDSMSSDEAVPIYRSSWSSSMPKAGF